VIDRKTVMHVAELAALSLDDAEIDALAKDLDAIVKHVDELSTIDTEGVEPMRSIVTAGSLRADVPQPSLSREDALAGADEFVVPAFVEAQ
jgi:aspartyl-tRNA(Asn)/glutamyl-tRNA(Gln) amidotransferase subunit C